MNSRFRPIKSLSVSYLNRIANGKIYFILVEYFSNSFEIDVSPKLTPSKSYIALKNFLLVMLSLKLFYLTVARNLFLTILQGFLKIKSEFSEIKSNFYL